MSATRVPLNFFGIGFGLAGLGEAWGFAAGQGLAPRWVSDASLALSAVAWLAGISLYLRYAATTRGAFAADLRDHVAGPFASMAAITPMLLAAAAALDPTPCPAPADPAHSDTRRRGIRPRRPPRARHAARDQRVGISPGTRQGSAYDRRWARPHGGFLYPG